ncbi:MAG: nucleotidyltransferase domain-containing protein [Candidatus Nanoarchaeia archaeon]|nr:nucleotidyltransferase domain-containing protein [Candidatus Nanoarchaeia archaeon]
MLKKLEIYSDLKKIFSKRKDILDVILFGSIVKGKTNPNDIDICIIFKEKIDKELIRDLNKNFENVHFSILTADNFFKNPHALIRTLLFEGESIITNKKISEIYGLKAYSLFTYDIKKLDNSKKVRFLYLLKGRRNEIGIVKEFNGNFIGSGSFIIPIEKDKEMLEILEMWEIKFERKSMFLIK